MEVYSLHLIHITQQCITIFFIKKIENLRFGIEKAKIKYKKPATTHLMLEFKINKDNIISIEQELNQKGKFEIWHSVQAVNKSGDVCAEA